MSGELSQIQEGLVSVLIPVYNGARYLAESIDSALAQTHRPVEIIVIDDGSTDDSAMIAQGYGDRITFIQQANAGTAAARNTGIRASRGEFIALLDQDDLWLANHLKRELPILDDPQVALAYSAVGMLGGKTMFGQSELYAGDEVNLHQLLSFCTLPAATFLIRRRALDELGMFDEKVSGPDDWEICIRLATKYRLKGTPEITAMIRLHGNNQGSNSARMDRPMRAIMRRYRNIHGTRCVECKRAFAHTFEIFRETMYDYRRTQAIRAAQEGRYLASIGWRTQAILCNPNWWMRMPRIIAKRMGFRANV